MMKGENSIEREGGEKGQRQSEREKQGRSREKEGEQDRERHTERKLMVNATVNTRVGPVLTRGLHQACNCQVFNKNFIDQLSAQQHN